VVTPRTLTLTKEDRKRGFDGTHKGSIRVLLRLLGIRRVGVTGSKSAQRPKRGLCDAKLRSIELALQEGSRAGGVGTHGGGLPLTAKGGLEAQGVVLLQGARDYERAGVGDLGSDIGEGFWDSRRWRAFNNNIIKDDESRLMIGYSRD